MLAVPRTALFQGDWPTGFLPCAQAVGPTLLEALERHGRMLRRADAEADPSHKQPIPYCLVRHRDAVFTVERLPKQGEARLRGRLSVGLGGHVGPEDAPRAGSIARGLLRELREELQLPDPLPEPQLLGLVNSEADAVGQVHVGLVYALDLTSSAARETVQVREIRKMRGGWRGLVGWRDLWQDAPNLERWSRLVLDAIDGSTAPSDTGRTLLDPAELAVAVSPREESDHGGTQHPQPLS